MAIMGQIDEGKVVFLSNLSGKGIQDIILFTLFISVHTFVKKLFQHENLFKGIYTHKFMHLFKWSCVVCKVITFMLSSPP